MDTAENDLDVVEKAKRIRDILKRAFPGQKFTVRSDRYSLGESIDITWTDGVATDKVRALGIEARFEDIDRDSSGEILAGGNSYVQIQRSYTEEARRKVEDQVWKQFAEGTFRNRNDPTFMTRVWQELHKTDL